MRQRGKLAAATHRTETEERLCAVAGGDLRSIELPVELASPVRSIRRAPEGGYLGFSVTVWAADIAGAADRDADDLARHASLPDRPVPYETIPIEITDPINARILAVSEDRIADVLSFRRTADEQCRLLAVALVVIVTLDLVQRRVARRG